MSQSFYCQVQDVMDLQTNLTTDMRLLREITQSRVMEWPHFSNTEVCRVKGGNKITVRAFLFLNEFY